MMRLVLELPDRRVTFPPRRERRSEALLDGGTHVVGELPGMPEADQVVLVRRLLREGVWSPPPGRDAVRRCGGRRG